MKRGGGWRRWSVGAMLVAALLCSATGAFASFGHHGKRVISHLGIVWDALPYGSSKTLLVSGLGAESKITRLRANGSVDRAFGDNGHVDIPLQLVAVQPDGGILVLVTTKRAGGDGSDPVLTRLLPDGSVDNSFGQAGSVEVDLGDRYDEGAAMTVLPDGIVIAGRSGPTFESRTGVIRGDVVVARLSASGRLDRSFDGDGRVVVPPAEEPAALRPGPDGTIYLQDGGFRRLIRLTRNGTVDESYGQQGTVTIPFQVEPPETFFLPQGDFAVLPDGGVMIAATLSTSGDGYKHNKVGVLRLRPDGSVSGGYGNGGLARVGIPGGWVSASGVAATADGRAVVVGASQVPLGSRSHMTAFVFNPAGKLDGRFGRGGRMTIGFGGWVTGDDLFLRRGKAFLVGSVRGPKTLLAQVPLVRHR